MTNREKALAALKMLRADNATLPDMRDPRVQIAVWEQMARKYTNGTDHAPDTANMLSQIIATTDRALPTPLCVRLDRDELGRVCGLIVCPDMLTARVVPVRVHDSIVTVGGDVIFVGRAHGRDQLRRRIIDAVAHEIEHCVDDVVEIA